MCLSRGSPLEWAGRLGISLEQGWGWGLHLPGSVWATGLPAVVRGAEPWTHCLWAWHCTGDPLARLVAGRAGCREGQLPLSAGRTSGQEVGLPHRQPRQGHPWDPGQRPSQGPSPPFPPASEALGTCLFFRSR